LTDPIKLIFLVRASTIIWKWFDDLGYNAMIFDGKIVDDIDIEELIELLEAGVDDKAKG
jgi:hypothetical protein